MTGLGKGLWVVALGLLGSRGVQASRSVNVDMKAAFPAGPYLLELLETAAAENSTAYFPLLDRIAAGHFAEARSEQDLYEAFLGILKADGHISTPEGLSTFNLALSLRSAAPRIEAYYQHYSTTVESRVADQSVTDCGDFVIYKGKRHCTPEFEEGAHAYSWGDAKPLPFDRALGAGPEAVLYADIESADFVKLHNALTAVANSGGLSYRLRYRPTLSHHEALPVNGYGVELALKRTDYIVIDDREAHDATAQKPLSPNVELNSAEEVADLKPLSKSELSDLGEKAASFILDSENPLETLVKLTQDFPKFSSSLVSREVSKAFTDARETSFGKDVPTGLNYLWVNGLQLIERQIQPHGLMDILRRERRLIDEVRDLGFSGKEAVRLLGYNTISNSKVDEGTTRYDWTDKREEGNAILWLNDLENDERYQDYPKSVTALMQRSMPGQLPAIGQNIFNVVVPTDLTDSEDLAAIHQVISILSRGIPVRFGLVPIADSEEASITSRVAHYLFNTFGSDGLISYLTVLKESEPSSASETVLKGVVDGLNPLESAKSMKYADLLEAVEFGEAVESSRRWLRRLSAGSASRVVFANGMAIARAEKWVQAMAGQMNQDLQLIQQALFYGALKEAKEVSDLFLERAATSRNAYIIPEEKKSLQVLDVNKIIGENKVFVDSLPHIDAQGGSHKLDEFQDASAKDVWVALTVMADFTHQDGLELLYSAVKFHRNTPGLRLEFVHNPLEPNEEGHVSFALSEGIAKVREAASPEELKSLLSTSGQDDGQDESQEQYLEGLSRYQQSTGIKPGESKLVMNGRVVGPLEAEMPFLEEDFQELLEFEFQQRIKPVFSALGALKLSHNIKGPLDAAKLTSLVALSTISDLPEGIFESATDVRVSIYETWDSKHTTIEVGDPETSSIHVVGLLNPLSEQGQRWAPILKILSQLDGVYLKIFLNPKNKIDELPVKRFYRFVLDAKPSFDEDGKLQAPRAVFKGVPSEALLTVGVDVPPTWLVSSKESVHDLDNVKLSGLKSDVDATYELEHILIEGHSRESRGSPPRGAQLVLTTAKDPRVDDTIVMSNLGYFQFKANPGSYNIELKKGRSVDIFDIESVGAKGHAAVPGDENTEVSLIDFQGPTLYPRLKRKPGMEGEDVLEQPSSGEDSILGKGLKYAESLLSAARGNSGHADINIFSVASGHLYERMLNIMILSVMKQTKHSVKFWFIEQFLSPSFKESIPHLAAEYNFQYEMITYRWPHWLRQQKEKQREIWGYKILFLDVLFPLDLDKVIFVDADQIVRTDMMDLVRTDLQGAPYGFTPMCDSRTSMDGFRFWKTGYWASYLRGQPYHISALYVVDLRRFRALAAGDRLRQQYHTLSADPASLANLDQDLPNHMQFQIPIHSLDQEWLWCETWCSDESLGEARTIDLCNNPETREPKLDRARRLVPEWTEYDDEVAELMKRVNAAAAADNSDSRSVSESAGTNTKSRNWEEPVHTKDEL